MKKTKATLILNESGQVKAVRFGETEVPVAHGGPALVNGTMGLSLSIADCDITTETEKPASKDA